MELQETKQSKFYLLVELSAIASENLHKLVIETKIASMNKFIADFLTFKVQNSRNIPVKLERIAASKKDLVISRSNY